MLQLTRSNRYCILFLVIVAAFNSVEVSAAQRVDENEVSCTFDTSILDPDRGGGIRPPLTREEAAAEKLTLSNPPLLDGSPGAMGHYTLARQGSSWLTGPTTGDVRVQVVDLETEIGKKGGASPWHVVSTRRYDSPGAVTLWGSTIQDTYRVVVDGDRFEALDRFQVNRFPSSLTWNLVSLDSGQVIVPDQDGFRGNTTRKSTRDPSYLILTDDANESGKLDQGISLQALIEMDVEAVSKLCGWESERMEKQLSFTFIDPTYTGEWIVSAVFQFRDVQFTYLVALDSSFQPIDAVFVDRGLVTNARAAEPQGETQTAIYLGTESAIAKVVWDSKRQRLRRVWKRQVNIRGRTGTTPTLLNTRTGEKFVVLVEAQAAVKSVTNGLIVFSEDTRESSLIAVRREDRLPDGVPHVQRTVLPKWLTTVENSPAVFGDTIVLANYSGYLPNGLIVPPGGEVPEGGPGSWLLSPDAVAQFATGVVALQFNTKSSQFDILWTDSETQVNSIPAISGSANRVYGIGAEKETGMTYVYGYRLCDDEEGPAGERILRSPLGRAPFREPRTDINGNVVFRFRDYSFKESEFFDQGNSIIILEDGSLIISGGRSLARVYEK